MIHAPDQARALAEAAICGAAAVKNNPPDLINVALEELIRAGLELPAFSTLDEMASRIRLEVNRAIFEQILARMTSGERDRLTALLVVVWPDHTSAFNRLKKPAKRATWSHFKALCLGPCPSPQSSPADDLGRPGNGANTAVSAGS